MAVLLRKLAATHAEFPHQWQISSFYPLQCQFGARDGLDWYGGVVRLRPVHTPLQWIETLRQVTPEGMALWKERRERVQAWTQELVGATPFQFRKGFSSSHREYYEFLQRISETQMLPSHGSPNDPIESHALSRGPIVVTIEASEYRRPKVTSEGTIRLGAGTASLSALYDLAEAARQQAERHQLAQARVQDSIQNLQCRLGVTHVYRLSPTADEFCASLARLPSHPLWVGHALAIAGAGQFCHLGDDGRLVIPHNFL